MRYFPQSGGGHYAQCHPNRVFVRPAARNEMMKSVVNVGTSLSVRRQRESSFHVWGNANFLRLLRVVGLLGLMGLTVFTSRAEDDTGPKSIAELQAGIERILRECNTPGASIAIVSRDKEEWVAGVGLADIETKKPATADTLFRIGSVSKAFTALAALKLQEEGKLKLSDTVKQWVPEVAFVNQWEETDPVRLVHLMEHTTGFDDISLREYALNDPTPISLSDALVFGTPSRVSRWRPGSRMAYCNSGPAVLAAVVEKASGQKFEDYIQTNFFTPLHMDTATYFYTPLVQERLTKMYRCDGVTPYPYWHVLFRPAGSINASARDMANYVRFYLQRGSLNGTQVLAQASIERMERTESLPSAKLGTVAGYGLYEYAMCEGGFVFYGHGGAVMGGLTQMEYLPDRGRGYAVMINTGNGPAMFRIVSLIRRYVVRDLSPAALPAVASISPEVQQHYTGYYEGISARDQWLNGFRRLVNVKKLTFGEGELLTSTYGLRGDERRVPVTDHLYRQPDQILATLALLPDADGETLIEYHWGTLRKISTLQVWTQLAGIALVSLLALSALGFAPIWIVRKLMGKVPSSGPLSLRVLPVLSVLLLIAFDGLLIFGLRGMLRAGSIDDYFVMGSPSAYSISLMILSIAFPLVALAGLFVAWRARKTPMNRVAYWHSVVVAVAIVGVAVYYGYWGLIGLRLWA